MQKTNLNKIAILSGLIIGSIFSITQINSFSGTLEETNPEPGQALETGTNENSFQDIQLYSQTESFIEKNRIKDNNIIIVSGEIIVGSEKNEVKISYEQTATKQRKIKNIDIEKNLELEIDLMNTLKKDPEINVKEIIQTIEKHKRNNSICEEIKNSIQNTQIIDCLSDIITLQTSGLNISFDLVDLTVITIETNQEEINLQLERFHNTTLNENAFVPYIINIIETIFEPTTNEAQRTQEISTGDEVKNKFEEVLGVNISTINQRGNDFLIEFSLKDLSMTANYKKDQNQIQGLFLKDIIINSNPLLIRTFQLDLQQGSTEVQNFIEDPLSFIEKFYPNIKQLYTKNN